MGKIKLLKITKPGEGGYVDQATETAHEEIRTLLSEGAPGDQLHIEVIEVEESDLAKMEEFQGW